MKSTEKTESDKLRSLETDIFLFLICGLLAVCLVVWSGLPFDTTSDNNQHTSQVEPRVRKKDPRRIKEHFESGKYSNRPADFANGTE